MNEIWKDISGYEGRYQVSNLGNVRSIDRYYVRNGNNVFLKGKELAKQVDASGRYWMVTLSKNGKEKSFRIHILVAKAFIPNPNNYPIVMHKDEKNLKYDGECNNDSGNLQWGTLKQNSSSPVARERNSNTKDRAGHKNPMYGKTQSEKTRLVISEKLKGKGGRCSRSKKVICDNILYDCVTDCARQYNIKEATMMSWLRGDRKMREDFVARGLRYA